MSNNQERIEELIKQRAEIEKEIKRLKGREYIAGRVKVAMRQVGDHRFHKSTWYLTIKRIMETNPQDNRNEGVIYCTDLESMPKYIDDLIQDLKEMKIYIESGGTNFE